MKKKFKKSEKGFSYIDVIIAILIMSGGILAMTQTITYGLIRSYETENRLIAKQIVHSTVESIFAARDIKRPGALDSWSSVGNIGSNPENGVPKGIFAVDWHPIREDAGGDGVVGTLDDSCPGSEPCVVAAGPANTSPIVRGYNRRIVITDIEDPERPSASWGVMRRKIEVTVRYQIGQAIREEKTTTIIANF